MTAEEIVDLILDKANHNELSSGVYGYELSYSQVSEIAQLLSQPSTNISEYEVCAVSAKYATDDDGKFNQDACHDHINGMKAMQQLISSGK